MTYQSIRLKGLTWMSKPLSLQSRPFCQPGVPALGGLGFLRVTRGDWAD